MEIVDLAARYKIEKTLGKGGMGEVLLATDTRLNRKVAIKRILGDAARSKTSVNRFLTEAKSIAALNHPNVFQIYDYGRAQDGPFLIMEFVDGSSLLDRCREGALPLDEAVDLACQLCDGLGRAHDVGIIHRDIKPANVRMTADGIPKLTDFGLAKAESADTGMTMAGAVLGTLDFMPPEQRRDAALTDARSDLWSLAATLYQMVTGKSPKIIKFNDIPKDLQDVLDKALQDSKDDRYQSARELKEALRDSLNSARRPVPKPTADLGAGECPSCHTINESHRKFCRECGDPLRCKCLKCEHEIPVWDRVCPECGGKQAELVSSRMEEIHGLRQSAEQKKEDHQYQEALDIAQC
ncbi:MAG: protein kinase domain-containing protein, partial [Planctomycetota bacterium]